MSSPSSPMPAACLDHEDLAAYASGKLPEERVGTVREHLTRCPQCATLFEQVENSGEDSLIDLLRRVVQTPISPPTNAAPATSPFFEQPGHAGLKAELSTAVGTTCATVLDVTLLSFIGPYEILEEIRRGGMGIVYRAKQPSLDRHIALKMILPDVATPEFVQRFRNESRAIAKLPHPHVIEIFEFGDHDGQPYYTMELMEGGSLAETLEQGRLSNQDAAQLLYTLASTVDDMHREGIFHRDLKPANVLFTKKGVPKIGDFGLAKLMAHNDQTSDELTDPDAVMGTPSYMAPEQARGSLDEISPATDVYALGAILYRVLTGELVFRGHNKLETLDLVRKQAPIRPMVHVPTVDVNLEAICLKCLAKDPEHRYSTAGALAEDLRRWLEEGTTLAQEERRHVQQRRFVRRIGVALAMLLLCLSAVPGLGMFFGEVEQTQTESSAEKLRQIQQRLARGSAVPLVGQQGKPSWYEIKGGAITPKVKFDAHVGINKSDQSAFLASKGFAFAQLVRDPQHDHYRVRAEIRHDLTGFQDCSGGLFVGHRERARPGESVHVMTVFGFNDIDDALSYYFRKINIPEYKAWHKKHNRPLPPPPPGNRAYLISYFIGVKNQHARAETRLAKIHTYFQRHLGDAGVYRRLQMEVHPNLIVAQWEGNPQSIVIKWPTAQAKLKTLLAVLPKHFPTPLAVNLAAGFPGRGGLGVYVRNGKISFRNVVVEPLPTGN